MSLLKKLKKRMEEASNRAPDTKKLQREAAKRAQKQAQKKQTTSDMTKKSVETQKKTLKESKGGQAYTGFVRSTVGVPLEFTGKIKVDDEVKKSTAYKVGSFAGDALSFAGGYGAVGKLLAKKTAKTAAKRAAAEVAKDLAEKEARKASGKMLTRDFLKKASKETAEEVTEKAAKANAKKTVSEKAAERLAETKYFRNKAEKALTKKGGKEVSEKLINREALKKADKFVEKARQDLVTEATAGVALNTAKAKSEGMDLGSKEYLEYIGKQGALNLAMGAGFEGLGAGVKAIKNLKNGKSVVQIIENGKPKYKVIDTPRNVEVNPWDVAKNKRNSMREANREFVAKYGDKMAKNADYESANMRGSKKYSEPKAEIRNLDGTARVNVTPNQASTDMAFRGQERGMGVIDRAGKRAFGDRSTNVIDFTKQHEPSKSHIIDEYVDAVDHDIVDFTNQVRSEKDKSQIAKRKLQVNAKLSDATKQNIKDITGVDVSDYDIWMDGSTVVHTDKRHGSGGKADQMMSDPNDVGRLPYIMEKPDDVVLLRDDAGNPDIDPQLLSSNGKDTEKVLFVKKVDGQYYATVAVPDSAKKRLHVKGVYAGKEEVARLVNMANNAPHPTSSTPGGFGSPRDKIISQPQKVVNKFDTDVINNALADTKFRQELRVRDFNVTEYARNNNMSNSEAITKLYNDYTNGVDIFNIKDNPTTTGSVPKESLSNGSDVSKTATTSVDNISTDVPNRKNTGEVSQTADTLYNSPMQTKESRASFEEWKNNGEFDKRTESHKEALDKAQASIDADGYDKTADNFKAIVNSGGAVTQKNIAETRLCIEHFIKNGEYDKANDLMSAVVTAESEAGRNLQAMRMFNAMSPEGRVTHVIKQVKKGFERKGVDALDIPEDLLYRVKNAKTQYESWKAEDEIAKWMWDNIPATFVEKVNAWRHLSMLGNPKTHVRNVLGNMFFMPARTISNFLATGMEKAISKNGLKARTKAVINPLSASDRELVDYAKNIFDSGEGEMLRATSGKYLEKGSSTSYSHRHSESKVFNTKFLDQLSKANGGMLDKEDVLFMRPAYTDAYASYFKANGIRPGTATKEQLAAAAEYARENALYATYRDYSALAEMLNKVKRYSGMKTSEIPVSENLTAEQAKWMRRWKKTAGIAMESVLPYTKTPINIMSRGKDYSPIGLMEGIIKITKAKDAKELSKAIERIASGTTGSGLMLLGAYLGSKGLAQGGMDFQSKQDNYDKMLGQQEYSVTIGDYTYTLDWVAPMSMPFFVGVEAGKGIDAGQILDAPTQLLEPVLNLSMLSSLNNAFNTQFSSGNSISTVAKQTAEGYAGQFLPTIGGQLARTISPETTTTTATNESATTREYMRFVNQMKNKVPVLSQTNAPKVDAWGEKETKETGADYAKAAVQNFISPGTLKKVGGDDVDRELQNLRKQGADETILPNTKPSGYTFNIGEDTVNPSPKEYAKMQEVAGKESKKSIRELINSDEYKKMTIEEKQKAIKNIYSDSKDEAKRRLFEDKGYSATDIAWELDLTKSQQDKYGSKKKFGKKLNKLGITASDYTEIHKKGANLSDFVKAKENGYDLDTYISAKKSIKDYSSYADRVSKLIDGGYVSNYDEARVFDSDLTKKTWNAVVWAKNNGISGKRIAEVIGIDNDDDQKNRDDMKSYGSTTDSAGREKLTMEGLYKWIEKKHGNLSNDEKSLLWRYYGYDYSNWRNSNPY